MKEKEFRFFVLDNKITALMLLVAANHLAESVATLIHLQLRDFIISITEKNIFVLYFNINNEIIHVIFQ